MKLITVLTSDPFLFQKIKLSAPKDIEITEKHSELSALCLVDIDTEAMPTAPCLTMSRYKRDADIQIPFSLDFIARLVSEKTEGEPPLKICEGERAVILRDKKIKLTEVEFSLFNLLVLKKGEFCSREELLVSVWGKNADAGVLNVYIHYLREKLETDGEKIILSSRKGGYKVDEKYIGGKINA